MKGVSAAIIVLAGAICLAVGALISSPPQLSLTENGLQIGGPPFIMTARGILMIAGAVLGIIGLIGWIVAQRGELGDR